MTKFSSGHFGPFDLTIGKCREEKKEEYFARLSWYDHKDKKIHSEMAYLLDKEDLLELIEGLL